MRRRLAEFFTPKDLTEDERRAVVAVLVGLVVPLIIGAAIPVLAAVGLVWHEGRQRTTATRELIAEQAEIRALALTRTRQVDLRICREIEELKRDIVTAAREAGLPTEPARRFRPRPGGCRSAVSG